MEGHTPGHYVSPRLPPPPPPPLPDLRYQLPRRVRSLSQIRQSATIILTCSARPAWAEHRSRRGDRAGSGRWRRRGRGLLRAISSVVSCACLRGDVVVVMEDVFRVVAPLQLDETVVVRPVGGADGLVLVVAEVVEPAPLGQVRREGCVCL